MTSQTNQFRSEHDFYENIKKKNEEIANDKIDILGKYNDIMAKYVQCEEKVTHMSEEIGQEIKKRNDAVDEVTNTKNMYATLNKQISDLNNEIIILKDTDLKIDKAQYGGNCPIKNNEFYEVTSKVKNICEGKQSCKIPINNATYGDPSEGCYKGFSIDWSCRGTKYNSTGFENNMLELKCL